MASIGSIVGGAFGLFRQRPGAVALWAVTFVIGAIAIALVFGGMMAVMMGSQSPSELSNPAAMIGSMAGPIILLYLAYFMLMIVLMNAVFRAMLRPEESSWASLRLGMDELRMLGLFVVFFIAFLIIYFIVIMLFFAIVAGLGLAAGGDPTTAFAITGILGFLLFCGFIWFYVRISLLFPLSFYRRSFADIDGAWRLSSGRFWTLFCSYLVVWLLTIVAYVALMWFSTGGAIFSGFAGDPERMEQAMRAGALSPAMMVVVGILYIVIGVASIVLGPAIIASATRELLMEDGEALDGNIEQIFE